MKHNMTYNKFWQWLFVIALLCAFTLPVQAAVPDNVDYQGYLTDSGGSPINSTVSVTFTLYNIDTGGISLWTDTQSVTLTNGLFNTKLGRVGNPFPLGLFDAPLWLGIDVASDGEMAPRIAFSSAAFAHKADDALTLDGQSAASLDQSAHVTDTGNPHIVTTAQISAVSSANFSLHTGDANAHHTKTTSFTDLTDQASDAQIPAAIARNSEIMPAVLKYDGSGSTLDADLLDGLDSTAFMSSGADNWVNTTGDTMTGNLGVLAKVGIGIASPYYFLDVRGDFNNYLGAFFNNTTSGGAYGLYAEGDAYAAGTGEGRGAYFYGRGGSTSGNAYGTQHYAYAFGTSVAFGIYSNATGGTTTGPEYAFYGQGDGYFSGNVGIGTPSPSEKLTVAGTIESTSGGVKFPDSTIQITAARQLANHVLVAPSGGDYTSIQTAINAISPSESNPYLIEVAPGTYTEFIQMKSWIHLRGAGIGATVITHTAVGVGLIRLSALSGVKISNLTITDEAPTSINYGIEQIASTLELENIQIKGFAQNRIRSVIGSQLSLHRSEIDGDGTSASYGIHLFDDSYAAITESSFTKNTDCSVMAELSSIRLTGNSFYSGAPDGLCTRGSITTRVMVSQNRFNGMGINLQGNARAEIVNNVVGEVIEVDSGGETNIVGNEIDGILVHNGQVRIVGNTINIFIELLSGNFEILGNSAYQTSINVHPNAIAEIIGNKVKGIFNQGKARIQGNTVTRIIRDEGEAQIIGNYIEDISGTETNILDVVSTTSTVFANHTVGAVGATSGSRFVTDRAIKIESTSEGVEFSAGGSTITLAPTGEVTINSNQAVKISTTNTLNLEGSTVNIKAAGNLNLDAGGSIGITGGSIVDVNGALITLN